MAIQSSSLLDWADIQTIYTNLNIAKTNFNQTTVSIPEYTNNLVLTTHLSNLVTQIEAMSAISKIGSAANVGVTIPSRGELIYPIEFSRAASVAESISKICNFDAFDGFDGFDAFDGFDGFDAFDGFDGFDNFDSSFRSSFNSSFRSSFNSGFRSGFDGFQYSRSGCGGRGANQGTF